MLFVLVNVGRPGDLLDAVLKSMRGKKSFFFIVLDLGGVGDLMHDGTKADRPTDWPVCCGFDRVLPTQQPGGKYDRWQMGRSPYAD